ncbi:hypothetical protein IFO70_19870 [Phormidium tenue FACHB-886]|nr:hypothetical protein [Phormidium tenue FACHB-886]
MNANTRKIQAIAFFAGCLMVSSTLTGCATAQPPESVTPTLSPTAPSPTASASPVASSPLEVQQWATILKGEFVQGLTFTADGRLLYQDKVLLAEIPVSYVSNGDITYAERLMVSDSSPSGRFNVVKACEGTTNQSGLCWSVFLVDRQSQTGKRVDIAKYGGQNWVQWSEDERYAVFAESMEGVTWFVALDLQSGESKLFEQTSATADLSSFTWVDDRTFQANTFCDDRANCTDSPFRGSISALFSQ